MPNYLGMRIIQGALDYSTVVSKYPQYKEGIDSYLENQNRSDLIV